MYTQQDKIEIKNRIIKYCVITVIPVIALFVLFGLCLTNRWEIMTSVALCGVFSVICFMWLMFIWPCMRYSFFLKDMQQGIGRELTGKVVEISDQEEIQDGVRVLPMRFHLQSEDDERIVYLNATKRQYFPKAGDCVTLKCFGRHIKEIIFA